MVLEVGQYARKTKEVVRTVQYNGRFAALKGKDS